MAKVLSLRDAIEEVIKTHKYVDGSTMTQYKLAKMLQVEPVMVTHWKRGTSGMSNKVIKRFFTTFGIVIQP